MQPYLEIDTTMASTRLQRKERKNRLVAKKKTQAIQRLNAKPVIKNIDIDKIKEEFEKGNINRPVEFKETAESKTAKAAPKKAEKKSEKPAKEENKKAETKKAEPAKAETKKADSAKVEKSEPKKEETAAEGVDVDALLKSVGKADEANKDDLKKINGIGPAFEKKLNEIGLYTYEQISNLKKNDIENLAKMEGVSTDKIESDNWVESAKTLKEANKGE